MLVGKNCDNVINNELLVDSWSEEYVQNNETGETELVEKYLGEFPIGQEKNQLASFLQYLKLRNLDYYS